jgi:hypothetical protein
MCQRIYRLIRSTNHWLYWASRLRIKNDPSFGLRQHERTLALPSALCTLIDQP